MSPIDPTLRIRGVRLGVSDLDRSSDFYERVLGLPAIERDGERALHGSDGQAALELVAVPGAVPAPRTSTGLFHVAWLHPSRAALAESIRRVAAARWPLDGASDHGVSEALYLSDPDGLGIEIYADRPRESWRRPPDGRGVEMVTLPLDLEDLLASGGEQVGPAAPPGTGIGHVHLKVADVGRSEGFYRGLGFEEQARMPSAAFVSAGGYHHHLGLNSWLSAGGAPAPDGAPGLRLVEFELAGEPELEAVAEAAAAIEAAASRANGTLTVIDPEGIRLEFGARR